MIFLQKDDNMPQWCRHAGMGFTWEDGSGDSQKCQHPSSYQRDARLLHVDRPPLTRNESAAIYCGLSNCVP